VASNTVSGGIMRAAHSIYFEVLGDQGIVGLAIFLAIAVSTVLHAGRVIRACRGSLEFGWAGELARMIRVSVIAYLVGGAALSLAYLDIYYVLGVILVLLRAITASSTNRTLALDLLQRGRYKPVQAAPSIGPGLGNRG
jgi:hypothetical protein